MNPPLVSSQSTEILELTPTTYLSAEQITTFYAKGYVHLRHAFSPSEVKTMEAEPLENLRSEKIVHTFLDLLNCDEIEHLICQNTLPDPFKKDADWMDVRGNGSYALALIAFQSVSIILDKGVIIMKSGDMLFLHPDTNYRGSDPILATGYCVANANRTTYPGAHANDLITVKEGRIYSRPAPWKKVE